MKASELIDALTQAIAEHDDFVVCVQGKPNGDMTCGQLVVTVEDGRFIIEEQVVRDLGDGRGL